MGLIVAPSCNDCHGVHDIKRSVDQSSRTNKANIADTCGQCHVGIEAVYSQSVHGCSCAKGDTRGPVCSDCHSAHQIAAPVERRLQGAERPGLRPLPPGPARPLPRHLPRQGDGARAGPTSPPTSRPATTATAHHDVFPVSDPRSRLSKRAHPRDLPAVPPGRRRRSSPSTARTPTRWTRPTIPLLHTVYVGMTALLIGVFAVLRAAHAPLARPLGLPLPQRLEDVPGGEDPGARRRRAVHPLHARSSASCT